MNIDRAAGALLVGLPIAFNLFFFLLGRLFDYPAILRSPVGTILSRFQAGGLRLKLVWYGFMLTAVLLAPLAVLLGQVLARDGLEIVPVATTIGVLAATVQFLGLARWPFLVPALARTYEDPNSSAATREATAVVFDSFNRYLGVAVGECLGYLLHRRLDRARRRRDAPVVGVRRLAGLAGHRSSAHCSSSVRSSSSAASRRTAGSWPATIVPIAYTAWSLWLLATGVVYRLTVAPARLILSPENCPARELTVIT